MMSITKEVKKDLISKFKINEVDTGSAEVQIPLLTERITNLTNHLKIHKKDFSCRRGLLILVGRRKSMLSYLKKQDAAKCTELVKKLGLRKVT
jgi:small subunit ribosomal protein S15